MGQPLSGTVEYLSKPIRAKCEAIIEDDFHSPDILLTLFRHR